MHIEIEKNPRVAKADNRTDPSAAEGSKYLQEKDYMNFGSSRCRLVFTQFYGYLRHFCVVCAMANLQQNRTVTLSR